jgi:hypothetical protein
LIYNDCCFCIFEAVNWTELIENQKIKLLLAEHETQDPAKLALKWAGKTEIPATFLLTQIKARQKAKSKIPGWYNCKSIVYPDQTALEQCSSELTAQIKAVGCDDLKVIDLTGGLGIDSWAFSKKAKTRRPKTARTPRPRCRVFCSRDAPKRRILA